MVWGIYALLVADCRAVIGLVTDLFHPLSIEEQREQSER
jgi:hypothetical protein